METIGRIILLLVWLGVIAGAGLGGAFIVLTLSSAQGAPQEAAGAAIGLSIMIGHYVVARAFTEIGALMME